MFAPAARSLIALVVLIGVAGCASRAGRGGGAAGTPGVLANGPRDVLFTEATTVRKSGTVLKITDYILFNARSPDTGDKEFTMLIGPADGPGNTAMATWRDAVNNEPAQWELGSGFAYFCGWRPFGRTTRIRASAESTLMAIQIIAPDKERVYFFRRDDKGEKIKISDVYGNSIGDLAKTGYFIEITQMPNGSVSTGGEQLITADPSAVAFRDYIAKVAARAGMEEPPAP